LLRHYRFLSGALTRSLLNCLLGLFAQNLNIIPQLAIFVRVFLNFNVIYRQINYEFAVRILDLDLDIHASWHVQPHQHVNSLCVRVKYIDQAIVRTDFKMLM